LDIFGSPSYDIAHWGIIKRAYPFFIICLDFEYPVDINIYPLDISFSGATNYNREIAEWKKVSFR